MKDTDNHYEWLSELHSALSKGLEVLKDAREKRKARSQPPLSKDKERIEVSVTGTGVAGEYTFIRPMHEFQSIPQDKFPSIKQAIESALNEDTVVGGIEEAGIAAVKISEQLNPKLTSREQAIFIAGFQECIKWQKSKTDTVVEDKEYVTFERIKQLEKSGLYWMNKYNELQSEVDAIREETWKAARKTINDPSVLKYPLDNLYPNFSDYLQSLTKDKEVDTVFGINRKMDKYWAVQKNTLDPLECVYPLAKPYNWVTFETKDEAEQYISENKGNSPQPTPEKSDTGKDSKVLFTTEDGVGLTDRKHEMWAIRKGKFELFEQHNGKWLGTWLNGWYTTEWISNPKEKDERIVQLIKDHYLLFSTKEAAEQYIRENKPCLSLNDLIDAVAHKYSHKDYFKTTPMFKDFENKLNQKLKTHTP